MSHVCKRTRKGARETDVHIASDQDGTARLRARQGGRQSSVAGELGAGPVRLDPARGVANNVWWQSARTVEGAVLAAERSAILDREGVETPEPRLHRQESGLRGLDRANSGQGKSESHRRRPWGERAAVPSATIGREPAPLTPPMPAPMPDRQGWRLPRWRSLSRRLRDLFVPLVRDGRAGGSVPVPFGRKATEETDSGPLASGEVLSEVTSWEETPAVEENAATQDCDFEIPSCDDALSSEATAAVAEVASAAPAGAKACLGLGEMGPVFLFAGEMSHAAGVDILADALCVVCHAHQGAWFVLVGEGPLKSEAEARVSAAGFAHRCRFTGDLPAVAFEPVLAACDFVVIPAREGQDDRLSARALSLGKPVLTTHQALIRGIVHGLNGLVVYDCANSLVWGLSELLAKPRQPLQEFAERKVA